MGDGQLCRVHTFHPDLGNLRWEKARNSGGRDRGSVVPGTLCNPGRLPEGGAQLLFQEQGRLWSPRSPPPPQCFKNPPEEPRSPVTSCSPTQYRTQHRGGPLVTCSLAVSEGAGLCLCKIQMEKNCSLPMFMATLSLRGDFSLPLPSSWGNSQNKEPCFAFAENEKAQDLPRAQACDAGKSIFCFTTSGGICI